jgi:hypothetical protein
VTAEEEIMSKQAIMLGAGERVDGETYRTANVVVRRLPDRDAYEVLKNRYGETGGIVSADFATQLVASARNAAAETLTEKAPARTVDERICIDAIGYDSIEARGSARAFVLYADKSDGDVEYDARVDVTFIGESDCDRYGGETLEKLAEAAALAVGAHLAGGTPAVTPAPVAALARGEWTSLGELGKGLLFETEDGTLAVKSEYSFGDRGFAQCVLLGSGEYAAFRDGNATRVREVRLA